MSRSTRVLLQYLDAKYGGGQLMPRRDTLALGSQQWILGDNFSAADIMLVFGMMIADYFGYVNDDTPQVRAYLERAMTRPAFQRAVVS